jgi:hypothetical protein
LATELPVVVELLVAERLGLMQRQALAMVAAAVGTQALGLAEQVVMAHRLEAAAVAAVNQELALAEQAELAVQAESKYG